MIASQESYLPSVNVITEIEDGMAEKVFGGIGATPSATEGSNVNTAPKMENATNIPSLQPDKNLGLTPFFPDLPTTKLPRLGPLDPANRTAPTPKNAITVTIPLPLPV
jgi:hypothetical protein